MNPKRSTAVDVLKAVAALLIINSHLEHFHLRAWMSVDGMLGNTIFFFTAGCLLSESLCRSPGLSLRVFFVKRLLRMYPEVWIITLILPPDPVDWSSIEGMWKSFVYPTQFSFVYLSVPLYPLFYLALKTDCLSRKLGVLGSALLVSGGIGAWMKVMDIGSFSVPWSELGRGVWTLQYGGAMCIGAWMSAHSERRGVSQSRKSGYYMWGLVVVGSIYLFLRALAVPSVAQIFGGQIHGCALLAMPVAVAVAACAFKWLELQSLNGVVALAVGFLAVNSWQTYLVHVGLSHLPVVRALSFPWGLFFVFSVSLLLAPLLRLTTVALFRLAKPEAGLKH